MKHVIFILTMGLLPFLQSCKDEVVNVVDENPTNYVNIEVQPTFNAQNMFLDSVYTTDQGYKIKFLEIRFFMEDIRNGDKQLIDAGLYDLRERGTKLVRVEGKAKEFKDIQANLGVQSSVNHLDPSAFPNESVLNITNANDMHWNWSPGYIFLKVEAKVDTIIDGTTNLNHNVVYHVGLDENLQTLSFSNLNWMKVGNEETLYLNLDMSSFLKVPEVIDVKDEFSSHSEAGQEVLSLKVISNFKAALSSN